MQRYHLCLPKRQLGQTEILRDLHDLIACWLFPPHQVNEVVIGVCEAGMRELKALDSSTLERFFTHYCGPLSRVYIVSHAEIQGEAFCQ